MAKWRGLTKLEVGALIAGGLSLLFALTLVVARVRRAPAPAPSPTVAEPSKANELRYSAHRTAGLSAFSRGTYDVAIREFTEALKYGPANSDIIELLKVSKEFKAGTREVEVVPTRPENGPTRAAVSAKLEITIEPMTATVMLDGERVELPLRLTGADGKRHRIVASAPGYLALTREFLFDRDFSATWALREAPPSPAQPLPPSSAVEPPPQPVDASVEATPPIEPEPKPAPPEFFELAPKPKPTNTTGQPLELNVFDEKKPEIDREQPFDTN